MNVEKYFYIFSLGTFAFIPTAFNYILTETFYNAEWCCEATCET